MCIFAAMMLVAGLRPVYFLAALIGGTALVPFVEPMTDDKQARFLSLILSISISLTRAGSNISD